jgi:PAS domain S-box-containing protein
MTSDHHGRDGRGPAHAATLIVDNIPGLVALLTASGEVATVNRQLFDYFGRPLDELRRWTTNDIVHPDDRPHVVDVFSRSIASGTPCETTQRFRRADGVYRWFTNRGCPVRGDDGRPARWCVLLTDIDERRRAEEAVDRARSELAHVARVSTVNALTVSIAHEINQPLTGIVTNAGTCLRLLDGGRPDLDGARDAARKLLRDANRAADVIARLRALFSRQDFSLEPLHISDVAREVIALASGDMRRERVVLQAELADDLPLVRADRVQLQQVVLNLLGNAVDAMRHVDAASRRLLIRTDRADGGHVRLLVRDTGAGLRHGQLDKLFNAFHTTKPGGMGIGLWISRSIVERHDGRLWAEPNDGAGATFAFTLPAIDQPPA